MAEAPYPSLLYQNGGFEMTLLSADRAAPPLHAREEGEAAAALQKLLTQHPPNGGVETALPAGRVMMMVLDLPATEAAEIGGMVQLQAEEISPFPPDRTCAAWELLSRDPPRSRVLLALCARKELEEIRSIFATRTLVPERVDVDILGWLELLKTEAKLLPDTEDLVMILQGENCYVTALQQGSPRLIRSVMRARELSPETLREELMMMILSLESGFGMNGIQHLRIWHDGEMPFWADNEMEDWTLELNRLEDLPPLTLGLALRGASGRALDLAPKEWKTEEAQRQARKKNLRTFLAVGGCWLLLMLGFLGWSLYRQSGVRKLENQNAAHAARVGEVRDLASQVRSLTQFTDRSSSALETLLLLANATPGSGNLVLEDFRYEKSQGLVFNGSTAGDVQPFYQFLENLSGGGPMRVKSYDLKEGRRGFNFQVETVWAWLAAEEMEESP